MTEFARAAESGLMINRIQTSEEMTMENAVKKLRDPSFDIAKAFGMIAVILGHMSVPGVLGRLIFSFHMPLFFLINGYFFKEKDIKTCLVQKTKTLLVPYISTSILVVLSSTVFNALQGASVSALLSNIKMWILAAMYGSGTITHFWRWDFHIIGAIWFLLAMFWADNLFNFLLKKTKHPYLWGLIAAAVGYFTTDLVWLPTSIQAGMTAILFIEIGHVARRYDLLEKYRKDWLVIALAVGLWGYSIFYGGRLYMVRNYYGNGILDVLGAVSAAFLILKFSSLLSRKLRFIGNALAKFGENSLTVLCFHLVELNTFPWYLIQDRLPETAGLVVVFLLKVLWSVAAIWCVNKLPVLRMAFGKFPARKANIIKETR